MNPPKLQLDVVPSKDGKVYYLPLVRRASGRKERLKIAVRLKIKHVDDGRGRDKLTIERITFSFPGRKLSEKQMKREQQYINPEGGELNRNQTATWSNGSVCLVDTDNGCPGDKKHYNQIYLDSPAPSKLKINIYCKGIAEPFSEEFELIPWTDPTGSGQLRVPFAISDLEPNEHVVTSAKHWYNGGSNGTQIYAHDITIQAFENGEWNKFKVADPKKNTDTRTFGRPVRAMATGEVLEVIDTFTDNPYGTKESRNYGSNFIRVKYGFLEAWYKHLKQGSAVVEAGDTVVRGQKLAECGNSGNTSSSHLHLECRLYQVETLCGFVFKDAWIIAKDEVPTDGSTWPKVELKGFGICEESSAIRPFGLSVIPPNFDFSVAEHAAIVAEVFGGASQGGDGFAIVNGKLIRIPPRGIKTELLSILDELNSADEMSKVRSASLRKKLSAKIAKIADSLNR